MKNSTSKLKLLISLFFYSIFFNHEAFFIQIGGYSIRPFMVISIFICISVIFAKKRLSINRGSKYILCIYFINLIILTLPTFYSPFFSDNPTLYFRALSLYIFQIITLLTIILITNIISIYEMKLLIGRVIAINSILAISIFIIQLLTKPFIANTSYIGINYTYQEIPRMMGFMSDPNYFALYISVFLWIYIFLPEDNINIDHKKIVVAILCILLTQSRAAIILNVVGLIFIINKSKNKKMRIANLLSLGLILIIMRFLIPTQLLESSLLRFKFNQDASSIMRYNLLKVGIKNIYHYPFGVGIGYIMEYYQYFIGTYKVAHNDFISIFIEGGIISLILYIISFMIIFFKSNKLGKVIIVMFVLFLNTLTAYYFDPIVPIFIAIFCVNYKFKIMQITKT